MIILFPSEPFSPKEVDSALLHELESAELLGFECFLFDHDEFVQSGKFKTNIPKNSDVQKTIMLRSWMLKEDQYRTLWSNLFLDGYVLINDSEQYLNCHYFPNAYPFIMKNAGLAWWTQKWNENDKSVDWKSVRDFLGGDVLIKDYVKSEKGNPDLFILKKELSNEEFNSRILKFIEARGKLFNHGLVFKKVENLKKYIGQTNEWRIFFLNGEPVTMSYNCEQNLKAPFPPIELVVKCQEISKNINSNFLTIDVAEKEDGTWIILETGDGQVSGLAAQQEPIKFYSQLMTIMLNKKNNNE